MPFKPGSTKPKGSGAKRGQRYNAAIVRRNVFDWLAEAHKHPVDELMKLMPQLEPKDQAKVWLALLEYISPKLSAQKVEIDDKRETETTPAIDVTPLPADELLKLAESKE